MTDKRPSQRRAALEVVADLDRVLVEGALRAGTTEGRGQKGGGGRDESATSRQEELQKPG